jgi:hypothetical protein
VTTPPQFPVGPQAAAPVGATTVNWAELINEASTGAANPVPPGDYDIIVREASHTTTQNGKLMFKVKMQILTGPQLNRTVYNNFVVSPENANALSFFFQHMAIFGMDQNFFLANPSPDTVVANLLNKQAKIQTDLRDWNGAKQVDVKKISPATPGVVQQQPGVPQMAPAAVMPAPAAVAPPVAAPVPAAVPEAVPQVPAAPVYEQPIAAPVAPPAAPAMPAPVAPAPVAPVAAPAMPAPAPAPVAPPVAAPVAPAPPVPQAPVAPAYDPSQVPAPPMPPAPPAPPVG